MDKDLMRTEIARLTSSIDALGDDHLASHYYDVVSRLNRSLSIQSPVAVVDVDPHLVNYYQNVPHPTLLTSFASPVPTGVRGYTVKCPNCKHELIVTLGLK
jgi:hypothetical protein